MDMKLNIKEGLYKLGERKVGVIKNKIFYTHRDTQKKHFYRKGQGYPIANEVLKDLKQKGVVTIRIIEKRVHDMIAYEAPLTQYLEAVMIAEGGFELQRCVPLKHLKIVGRKTG